MRRAAVIVPSLNEAPCVGATVRAWREMGAAQVRVVDNGSTDATSYVALGAGAHVLAEPLPGYGAAAWRGTVGLPPEIEWLVFSSADGSDRFDSDSARGFQHAVDAGAEFVLGERVSLPESRRRLTDVQRSGNALCCTLIAWGWGRRFRDMASLRAIRRDAFARLALRDRAFGWNIEMQVRALEEGIRIAEVPVRYFPRLAGQPKISGNLLGVLRASHGMLRTLVRLYVSRRQRSRASKHGYAAVTP